MTNDDLKELERLRSLAAVGPWRTDNLDKHDESRLGKYVYSMHLGAVCCCPRDSALFSGHASNMEYIAALHNALPALLAAVRERDELREKVKQLEEYEWMYNDLRD